MTTIHELLKEAPKQSYTDDIKQYAKFLVSAHTNPFITTSALPVAYTIEDGEIVILKDLIQLNELTLVTQTISDDNSKFLFPIKSCKSFIYTEPDYFKRLKTFENFPKTVNGSFTVEARGVTSFEHFPQRIIAGSGGIVVKIEAPDFTGIKTEISCSPSRTMFNLYKPKSLNGIEGLSFTNKTVLTMSMMNDFNGPLLNLFKVKGLKEVQFLHVQKFSPLEEAVRIVNKHLALSDGSAYTCQEDLMENDLHDFADF